MSKKYRKQKRKGSTLKAVAAGLIGLALIGAAFFLLRSNNRSSGELTGGTPALSVDPKSIDYGDLKDYTVKTFSIRVTNTGTGVLRFTGQPYIQVAQGCCPPGLSVGKMSLKPGESTTITSSQFMMHPGMDGKHDYAVHIQTNDPAQPDLIVHVLSNWSQ